MIRINLLPHRLQQRRMRILEHLVVAAGALVATVLIVVGAQWMASSELTDLQQETASLQAQNAALQKKIGKLRNLDSLRADVEKKLKLVDQLQEGRFHSLQTLYEISLVIPENVWLSSITDNGSSVTLSGLAESNKAVANFMRNLEASQLFDDVRLQVISRKSFAGIVVRSFNLSLLRVNKPANQKAAADVKRGGRS